MRALAAAGAAAVLLFGAIMLGLAGTAGMMVAATPADAAACPGSSSPVNVAAVKGLDDEQSRNAAAIISVGKEMGLPARAWVVAVATARQESTLRALPYGDDWWFGGKPGASPSRGLFQQMPSWGPLEVRLDPRGSARLFYEHLIAPVDWAGRPKPPWDSVPLAQAAQAVQGSAFPHHYADDEGPAEQIVRDLAGVEPGAGAGCRPAATVGAWALPLPPGKVRAPTREHHSGKVAVDLPLLAGEVQPVFAMAAGVATPMEESGGCGHGVYVRSGGDEWLYCHFSEQHVAAGQRVAAGDRLGMSGWSGHVEPPGPGGAHLHIQMSRDGARRCLQPALDALVAGREPPAELPARYPCVP